LAGSLFRQTPTNWKIQPISSRPPIEKLLIFFGNNGNIGQFFLRKS
jgi:hypothetical protein